MIQATGRWALGIKTEWEVDSFCSHEQWSFASDFVEITLDFEFHDVGVIVFDTALLLENDFFFDISVPLRHFSDEDAHAFRVFFRNEDVAASTVKVDLNSVILKIEFLKIKFYWFLSLSKVECSTTWL